ncbi:DUF2207 domain-containing protein [Bifidobacterium eulemuris]|uniref:DUF2207 domain-containing protein n=1 Tax=Bifidobacterium eulemuris TaxID=1765219 RepID=A0A261FYL3_9BIFI|nr:DUF2207 domain-containing protein [Bifidobacterium eulemuris]OZG64055.1 hypothetical protein BEUL_2257 [Bifidobacterium eulemuris]QOL32562.1 DUF2207 domain-containing protein [Bifidobacterium eulemuris]
MRKRLIRAGIFAVGVAALIMAISMLFVVADTDGADLSYRTLDLEATVQSNGDLTVTQHIDMKLRDRSDDDGDRPWKQLYQQYTLNSSNLTDISDISVTNVTTGETYTQIAPQTPSDISDTTWNGEYANHWYIADVSQGESDPQPYEPGVDGLAVSGGSDSSTSASSKIIEIGWNIPATVEADSLRFDVTMTLHDVATAWSDIVSLQWEPFGKTNQVPIGTVTGTVRFPDGVDEDTSWAWLHTERTSETSRDADGGLRFTAYDVKAGDYLDVVAAYDRTAADSSAVTRVITGDHLDALQADETRQEQQWREQQRAHAIRMVVFWAASIAIGVLLCVIGLFGVRKSLEAARYRGGIEYWRDPPGMSPASAATLIDVVDSPAGDLDSRVMTSTVLALAVKKAIAIYPGPASMYAGIDMSQATNPVGLAGMIGTDANRLAAAKQTSTMVILPAALNDETREAMGLSQSESACLDLFIAISKRVGGPVFDLKQMTKACKKWKKGYESLGSFTTACGNEYALLGATRSTGGQAAAAGLVGAVLGVAMLVVNITNGNLAMALASGLPVLIVGLFCVFGASYTGLTDAGQEHAGRCLGLKRYMQDFSDFSDRGAADIALWDWYMVYAAAFGISERVGKELAKAYPQVTDPTWLDSHASGSLLYWSYRPFGWYGYGVGAAAGAASDGGMGGPAFAFGGDSFAAGFGDIGSQLNAGFAEVRSTIQAAAPSSSGGFSGSGGSFSGGGFGGSSGGSGGGSFGGR